MSRASPGASLRAVMLLVMVLTQLLGPLLHGHIGIPKQTGLHVHITPITAIDSRFESREPLPLFSALPPASRHALTAVHDAAPDSHEPPEVDVEPAVGLLKPIVADLAIAACIVSALTLVLQAALACAGHWRPAARRAPVRVRWRDRIKRPSPAQAPPPNI